MRRRETLKLYLQGKAEEEVKKFAKIFQEVQQVVDSKQLNPMIRTQYMRTAFQIPFDSTVRVSLDTNLAMIKENPNVGPSCAISGRQDPVQHSAFSTLASLPSGLSLPLPQQQDPAQFLETTLSTLLPSTYM